MLRILDENRTRAFGKEETQDPVHRPGVHLHDRVGERTAGEEVHEPVQDHGAPPEADPPGAQAFGIVGEEDVNGADASGFEAADEIEEDLFTAFRLNVLEDDEGVDQIERERGLGPELIHREELHICDAAGSGVSLSFREHAGSNIDAGYMSDLPGERDGYAADTTAVIENSRGNEAGTQALANDTENVVRVFTP